MIHVSPRSRLEDTLAACRAERLVTLLREGSDFVRPEIIEAPNFLLLSMHDIVEERDGMTAPAAHHVEALLAFAEAGTVSGRLPSTAMPASRGRRRPPTSSPARWALARRGGTAATLRGLSPSATPNIRLVSLADDILGRRGRMTAAIRGIGSGSGGLRRRAVRTGYAGGGEVWDKSATEKCSTDTLIR
jgi:predicted protein tyrosine phosphatase